MIRRLHPHLTCDRNRGPSRARRTRRIGWRAFLLLAVAAALRTPAARANDTTADTDWYFATTLGTGVYRFGDRTVTVARLPFGRTLRQADEDRWGVRLKLPVSVGLYNLDNPVNDVLDRNFATLAVMPGVELEREVGRNWVLKPTASLGYAQDVVRGNRSTLYEVGTRSAWRHAFDRVDFILGNALLYAGNVAQDGLSQNFGVLSTGLNFLIPTGGVLMNRASNFGVHFVHYLYFDHLAFALSEDRRRTVTQQYELAFTFGTYLPVELFGFTLDRIGVAFRGGQDFLAFRLVTGFMY